MKKIILGILSVLMTTYGLRAQGITGAEYFFDKDPGVGKGTSLAIASGDSININVAIPIGALAPGFHNLFIRIEDSAQHWSLYEGRNFYVQPAVSIPPAPKITSAEYFFDSDPGQGNGTAVTTGAAADSVNVNIAPSAGSLTAGFHNMFIRTENASGQWSLYEGRNFYVQPSVSTPSAPLITSAEYFFDNDPGQGKGTPIATGAAADSINITATPSAGSLTTGFHNLFIRTENANGQWSLYEGRNFLVTTPIAKIPPASPIVAGEYFFDNDPGQGNGTAIAITKADSVNMTITPAISALAVGFHSLFIRTEDSLGSWSLYSGGNFYISPAIAASPQPARIVAAEYFFDKDPGQGKGSAIPGITASDTINVTQSLNASTLTNGSHNAFIRVKDSTNHWSLYEGRAFKVEVCSVTATTTVTKDSCFGGSDGTAIANPSGGTPPYTYLWNTVPPQTTAKVTGLASGVYSVTVTDSIGCPATVTATIGQPAQIKITTSVVSTTCGQNNGQAIVTKVSGGTGTSYTYSWSTVPVQTTASVSGLSPGAYSVTVFDQYGCSNTATVTIATSTTPGLVLDTVTPSKCGEHIGSATVTASGGVPPYRFSWNNGDTLSVADSLAAGNYIATVTDKNGCSTFVSVAVTNSDGPKVGVNTMTAVKCYGQSNGSISVNVIGGVKPYKYLWSTGATTSSIGGLAAGPYYITVTDASGCSGVQSFQVAGPSAAVSLATSTANSDCATADGTASVTANGGTSPYTYSWNTGATTTTATGLAAGVYSVTVIDANGCIDSTQAAVSSKTGPVIKVDSVTPANCSTGIGGTVVITVTGGLPTYTYLWSYAGNTNQNLTGVPTGTYNVTVTDNGGCVGTATAKVPEVLPAPISICEVTVDPASNHNYIIWDKSLAKKVAKYNVYKESTAPGLFTKIGSVLSTQQCTYVDSLSDPDVQSWRYEISQVDSCGYESPLSLPHKTMHLTISQGITSSTVNLIWDNYQGLPFNYYIVYRDTVAGIAKDSIGFVLNNGVYTYTDTKALSGHSVYYHMGINNPGGCTPSIESINYNASKSNTGNIIISGINNVSADLGSFTVFPNPSTGVFNFSLDLANRQNITLKIYNALGQVLSTTNYGKISGHMSKEIDLSGLSKGVYILQVVGDNGVSYKKVILQ